MNDFPAQMHNRLLLLSAALLCCIGSPVTQAQVVLDGSLAPTRDLGRGHITILPSDGRTVDRNLFHSFRDFNLSAGERATFEGPASVKNILSRVTGGKASAIDGTLRSNIADADFYFMNPAGVMFGPNATLEVDGAFHLTSADFVRLEDGTSFNAVPSIADVQLTSAPPAAFGFLDDEAGSIRFSGSQIAVDPGEHLSISGGDIEVGAGLVLDRFSTGSSLRAPGGDIDIVSVASSGEIVVSRSGLNSHGVTQYGDVTIAEASRVAISGNFGGDLYIRGGELILEDATVDAFGFSGPGGDVSMYGRSIQLIGSQINSPSFGVDSAGTLIFQADDTISLNDSVIVATGFFKGGAVELVGQGVRLDNGAQINVSTFGPENAGTVEIDVTDTLTIAGENESGLKSAIFSDSGGLVFGSVFGADGNAGEISINAGELLIANGASVTAEAFGRGNAGTIAINVSGAIELSGSNSDGIGSFISAETKSTAADSGAGGVVDIGASELSLFDGALIDISTAGAGRGGETHIEVGNGIHLSGNGSGIVSLSRGLSEGAGDAGLMNIVAGQLLIEDGAAIVAKTIGPGSGGHIRVSAQNDVTLRGSAAPDSTPSQILLDSGDPSVDATTAATLGDAGQLELEAGALQLEDGTFIKSDTFGTGRGGDLVFRVGGPVRLVGETALGRGALIQTASQGSGAMAGDGGAIGLTAKSLTLANGGQINAFTSGPGDAGGITINVDNEVVLSGNSTASDIRNASISGLYASSTGRTGDTGNAGPVFVEAGALRIENGAVISTQALGASSGGSIKLDIAGPIRVSGINSGGFGGRINTAAGGRTPVKADSGDITITADQLGLFDGGQISATTFSTEPGGDILIQVANDIQLSGRDGRGFDSGVFAISSGPGNSGNIDIHAAQLAMTEDASINVGGVLSGNSGDIDVRVLDSMLIENSAIETTAKVANGGNIKVTASHLVHLVDAAISATAVEGEGSGGNINIDPDFVILDGSLIEADAHLGPGGNISIVADQLIRSPDTRISATSDSHIIDLQGNVDIRAPEADISSKISVLPEAFLQSAAVLQEPCAARSGANIIRLARERYQALPDSPYALRGHSPAVFAAPRRQATPGSAPRPTVALSFGAPIAGCGVRTPED